MRLAVLVLSAGLAWPMPTLAQDLSGLSWLSGCWIQQTDVRTVEEYWTKPGGGVMLGLSRSVTSGVLGSHEFARIDVQNGALVLSVNPSAQDQASFTAISQGIDDIAFENLDHDFPQHIRYRAVGADGLHAEIDGPIDGQTKNISWDYRRCAP